MRWKFWQRYRPGETVAERRPKRQSRGIMLRRMDKRLERIERLVAHVLSDVEEVRGLSNVMLGPNRALASLATGQRIYVDPRDGGCAINLLSEGKLEEEEFAALRRFLRPGSVFLDVGANYGLYALRAAPYVRPGGHVIGYEPNPQICRLFRDTIYYSGLTDTIEARELGVHDTNGVLRFHVDDSGPGGAHIVGPDAQAGSGRLIDIRVVRLDDDLPEDLIVDAVKIDVEGGEEAALRGMRRLIERSPDIVILMEMIYGFFPDDAAFEAFARFVTDELKLIAHRIEAHGRLVPVQLAALRGFAANLLLSRRPLGPLPELTFHPEQLTLAGTTRLVDGALHWSAGAAGEHGALAFGPYQYLAGGHFRVRLDGTFDGAFLCTVQETARQIFAQRIVEGSNIEFELLLPFDARWLEVTLWPADASASCFVLRKAEFWRID